jgi:hypothetical protein
MQKRGRMRGVGANRLGLGFVSEQERRDAELFFADLMGLRALTAPRPTPVRPPVPARWTANVPVAAPIAVPTAPARKPYEDYAENVYLATEDDGPVAANIDVTVRLHGLFGGDLSSSVTFKVGKKTVATSSVGASASEVTVSVPKEKKYTIVITPSAAKPDDRYRATTKTYSPKAPYTHNALTVELNVNRWNEKNVYETWRDNDIDVSKAKQVSRKPLCGRSAQLNAEAEAKRDAVQKAFLALDATLQKEITDSLVIVGGYAFRTQDTGAFSNHSLGTAVDVNYNMEKKQNYHFRLSNKSTGKHLKRILSFVQEVVRTDAAFTSFDIFAKRTDLVQWDAAAAFNRLFPPFIEALVARARGTAATASVVAPARAGANMPEAARALTVTRNDIKQARDATTDKDIKQKLDLVLLEWDAFSAWLYGADVVDEKNRVLGRLLGMIPMHKKFVELMLNAGWSWGGNWKGSKDYMHFEDTAALARLQVVKPKAAEASYEGYNEGHDEADAFEEDFESDESVGYHDC